MRRVPPHQFEPSEPETRASRQTVPGSRVQRLQVLLLIALGLWFVDSGMSSEPEFVSSLVSDRGEIAPEGHAADTRSVDAVALERLLGSVNPNLASSELSRISAAVFRYSEKYGLDPELVAAVLLVESSARPWVRSPKGAVGLMQVMPHMMEPLGLVGNAATIESNIEAGCWILAGNIRRLGEEKGISSYFWGSDIRGLAYLEKVQATRAEVSRYRAS